MARKGKTTSAEVVTNIPNPDQIQRRNNVSMRPPPKQDTSGLGDSNGQKPNVSSPQTSGGNSGGSEGSNSGGSESGNSDKK